VIISSQQKSVCDVQLPGEATNEASSTPDIPVYFSQLFVREESPFQTFGDLRGCALAYNDKQSLSGYHCVEFRVYDEIAGPSGADLPLGPFFGRSLCTGGHAKSVAAVKRGDADVCALDCAVRDALMRNDPEALSGLRPLAGGRLGPHPAQPVVASTRLPAELRQRIADAFVRLESELLRGMHSLGYRSVTDATYARIREKLALCKGLGLLTDTGDVASTGEHGVVPFGGCAPKNKFRLVDPDADVRELDLNEGCTARSQ
jgi:ABC-type phosphate/phosphonate transport system substrate-binding protein